MNVTGVELVAAELGVALVGQLSGGTFGASLVTTGRGAKAVLKVLPKDEHWSEDRVRSRCGPPMRCAVTATRSLATSMPGWSTVWSSLSRSSSTASRPAGSGPHWSRSFSN
jgi:hypothetical protein